MICSIAAKTFDVNGLVAPLISQIKGTVSLGIQETVGEWDRKICSDLWNTFVIQYLEILKASLFKYNRIPKNIISKEKSITLVIQSDASNSLMICIHALFPTTTGNHESSLLAGKVMTLHK